MCEFRQEGTEEYLSNVLGDLVSAGYQDYVAYLERVEGRKKNNDNSPPPFLTKHYDGVLNSFVERHKWSFLLVKQIMEFLVGFKAAGGDQIVEDNPFLNDLFMSKHTGKIMGVSDEYCCLVNTH